MLVKLENKHHEKVHTVCFHSDSDAVMRGVLMQVLDTLSHISKPSDAISVTGSVMEYRQVKRLYDVPF